MAIVETKHYAELSKCCYQLPNSLQDWFIWSSRNNKHLHSIWCNWRMCCCWICTKAQDELQANIWLWVFWIHKTRIHFTWYKYHLTTQGTSTLLFAESFKNFNNNINFIALQDGRFFTGPRAEKLFGINEGFDDQIEINPPDLSDTDWQKVFVQTKLYNKKLLKGTQFLHNCK